MHGGGGGGGGHGGGGHGGGHGGLGGGHHGHGGQHGHHDGGQLDPGPSYFPNGSGRSRGRWSVPRVVALAIVAGVFLYIQFRY
jgi:hypothetical protein